LLPLTSPYFMLIGAHMPVSKGLVHAVHAGKAIGCTTLQIFTKSPGQWKAKPMADAEAEAFRAAVQEAGIGPVVVHDAYLINLAAPHDDVLKKSRLAFLEEIQRAEQLGASHVVTHCGSHLGKGEDDALKVLAESVAWTLARTGTSHVHVTLEITAGQGTSLGYRFEHIAFVMEQVRSPRVSVCFDIAHALAAGYDLRGRRGYAKVMREFDDVVGLQHVAVIHANDSKKPLGSRVDRHEHVGQGHVGIETFRCFVNDARWENVPLIVETPQAETMHAINVRTLRRLIRRRARRVGSVVEK
ncbi:MAG: deoxyribonuclease IV, partial [Abditibacteriales bacterium]|nr:deoxyribonuclease IV [Abditibacteriales bacterium]MDW8365443.1 deoxyribonuclease IV [Abditibacteriales bacterium]